MVSHNDLFSVHYYSIYIYVTYFIEDLDIESYADDTTIYRSSHPEVFLGKGVWKCAANLQQNTHAEVRFQ